MMDDSLFDKDVPKPRAIMVLVPVTNGNRVGMSVVQVGEKAHSFIF